MFQERGVCLLQQKLYETKSLNRKQAKTKNKKKEAERNFSTVD